MGRPTHIEMLRGQLTCIAQHAESARRDVERLAERIAGLERERDTALAIAEDARPVVLAAQALRDAPPSTHMVPVDLETYQALLEALRKAEG